MKEELFKSNLSKEVWKKKYRYKMESPLMTFKRVAKALASIEKDPEYWEKKFLHTLLKIEGDTAVGLKCLPGGRITANAGTRYQRATLFNCYINGPVKDAVVSYKRELPNGESIKVRYKTANTGDDMKNIMLTAFEQSLTLGSEGGWGFNTGFIRPRGTLVKGIGVEHPGVTKFLEILDTISDVIVAGNNDGYKDPLKSHLNRVGAFEGDKKLQSRKGAMLVSLLISHPDIQEFVLAKQKGGRLTKFNMSVLIPNDFMEAEEADTLYDLKFNGTTYKKVSARELYDLIMQATYNRAEPGVLFYDNLQANNPLSYLGHLDATNPCGEIGGNPHTTTVCLLGSPNLTQYVLKDRSFDWKQYEEDIVIFTRMLDNVNDLQKEDLPPYMWAIKNVRQFGMGLNGFGSLLYMMGIKYGSDEAISLAERLNRIKLNVCTKSSALLAKEKGAAPAFTKEFFETNYWKNFTVGKLDQEVRELVKKHGLRNLKLTTNPPLGNSSVVSNNVSNGLEPVFSHSYDRTYITEDWPKNHTEETLKKALSKVQIGGMDAWVGTIEGKRYLLEPHNRGLCQIETVYDYGYLWVKENFPEDLGKDYLITTDKLSVDDHLRIQKAFQDYLDQSVSKTINIPKEFPFEDFKQIYRKAHKMGLIGVTTYREGTMESVLTKVEAKKERNGGAIIKDVRLPSRFVNGPCEVIHRERMKFYIHFSYLPEDDSRMFPIAMWIQSNHKPEGEAVYVNRALKSLSTILQAYEVPESEIIKLTEKYKNDYPHTKLAKAVSMCLRHNLPIGDVVRALEDLAGDNVSTLLTAVRKFLSNHIEDGSPVTKASCLSCGGRMIWESGCTKCIDCGESKCG